MLRPFFLLPFVCISILIATASAICQVDADTTLLLKFNGTLSGEQGEIPTTATGTSFQPGIQGSGVFLPPASSLTYPAAGNIDAREGTIEFFIKPVWAGTDTPGQGNTMLAWGGTGGIYLGRDGSNNLILRLNYFGTQPGGEVQLNLMNLSSWQANSIHHVAFTYSNTTKRVNAYVDGISRGSVSFVNDLPLISAADFRIGSYTSAGSEANAVVDELRISNRARTEEEIRSRFFSFLTVTSISMTAPTQNLYQGWKLSPNITAVTDFGNVTVPLTSVSWNSSNQNVVSSDSQGRLVGIGPGAAIVTANVNGATANLPLSVRAPVMQPRYNPIPESLSTPATGSLYEVPVVILRYLPTADGNLIDPAWAPDYFNINTQIPLAPLEQQIARYNEILKFLGEERSRFRGYGSSIPTASLGYKVVADISIYEPMPPGKRLQTGVGDFVYHGEFFQMFERLGLQDFINNQGAKEVWIWGGGVDPSFPSYTPAIHPPENLRGGWESNMSSPVTGDISNSNRDNTDLPVFDSTYVVYGRNFTRLDDGALHIEGHQLESILSNVSQRQTGSTNFFWRNFAGHTTSGWGRGRCGDVHHPPHVFNNYDYSNLTPFNSDITDWRPDGIGNTISFSAATYRDTPYVYPNNHLPTPRYESHYHLFWSQSMPGYQNNIGYQTNPLTDLLESPEYMPEICQSNGIEYANTGSLMVDSAESLSANKQINDYGYSSSFVTQNRMTNWWQFTGAWDKAIRSGVGLYEPASCSYTLSSSSVTFTASGGSGSVGVTANTGCKWFASSNGMWARLTLGDLGNGNGTVSFSIAANTTGLARTTKIIIAGQPVVINQSASSKTQFDFDGDSKTDIGIYRPNGVSGSEWWVQRSSNGSNFAVQFGAATDKVAAADYTGDGKTDVAFWRPSNGFWYVLRSEDLTFYGFPFGANGDTPVPADYDADGKADVAVFRSSASTWYIQRSSDGGTTIQGFGAAGDVPVNADYDGDGKADIAIYRPSLGQWWLMRSSAGTVAYQFGNSTDKTVQGDYTGDGKVDVAFWRPSTGEWFVLRSEDNSFFGFPFGTTGDTPVPGDYDGDGRNDAGVFRSSNSTWYIQRTTAGTLIQQFGATGDLPLPNAYVR